MRRNNADDGFVVAARKESVAHIDALFRLPAHTGKDSRDVESLMSYERIKIYRCRTAGHRFYTKSTKAFDFGRMCRERGCPFYIARIKCVFLRDVFVIAQHAIADLRATMFHQISFVLNINLKIPLKGVDKRKNCRRLFL